MLALSSPTFSTRASEGGLLMPIGGGYSDTYAGFSAAAVANAKNNQVKIAVLPTPYSSDPENITEAEREKNLTDAEERRFQIEEACKRAAQSGITCSATLLPVFTRDDAQNVDLKLLDDLSAIFILGGDQAIAMQAIMGTPLEGALAEAYERGVVVSGTSAGAGMQSATMLAGYQENFSADNSLDFGAPDIWHTPEQHGLTFGIRDAILDQHFFQRGRMGRLLNAISMPEAAPLGIGIDAFTGVHVRDGARLEQVFGIYNVAILDAATYHAAESVQYRGANNTLSLRNVLVHLLPQGDFSYDLTTRQSSLGAPVPTLERTFEALALPQGAGPLLLAGDLSENLTDNPIMARFGELAGGPNAKLVIVASGYASERSANNAAEKYSKAIGVETQTLIVPNDATDPVALPDDVTGIVFIAKDQSKLQPALFAPLKDAWLKGASLLADNAAAALLGAHYSAHEPMPDEAEAAEIAAQKSFLQGRTKVEPALGLLNITVEPQILNDNRWGRLFSLAYAHADLLALGLTQNSAIELTAEGARVLGENAVVSLDLRAAKLALGTNEGFGIANGLLDVFATGDTIQPEPADVNLAPVRAPTPVIAEAPLTPSATPTAAPSTPTLEPTDEPTQVAALQAPTIQAESTTQTEPTAATRRRTSVRDRLEPLPVYIALAGVAGVIGVLTLSMFMRRRGQGSRINEEETE